MSIGERIFYYIFAILVLAIIFLIEKTIDRNIRKDIHEKIVSCFFHSRFIGARKEFSEDIVLFHMVENRASIDNQRKISKKEENDLKCILRAFGEYMLELYFSESLFTRDNKNLDTQDFFALYLSYFLSRSDYSTKKVYEQYQDVAQKMDYISRAYCNRNHVKGRLYWEELE